VDVVGRGLLEEFSQKHADARGPLQAWLLEVEKAVWNGPADIKARYPSASLLATSRVIFNIGGNKYRLEVKVAHQTKKVLVTRVGTHAEYDKWMY
jgi:mRNA interferase HigB